jgi:hypothetical protein
MARTFISLTPAYIRRNMLVAFFLYSVAATEPYFSNRQKCPTFRSQKVGHAVLSLADLSLKVQKYPANVRKSDANAVGDVR